LNRSISFLSRTISIKNPNQARPIHSKSLKYEECKMLGKSSMKYHAAKQKLNLLEDQVIDLKEK